MKNSLLTYPRLGSCMLLCGVLMLSACDRTQAPAAPAAARSDPSVVRVTPEMARNFKVASLTIETLDSSQEITGRIEANDQWVTRIGASVTGRVTEVLADVGHRVSAGQVLALLSSPELTQSQLNYLRAHAATSLAERAVDREVAACARK